MLGLYIEHNTARTVHRIELTLCMRHNRKCQAVPADEHRVHSDSANFIFYIFIFISKHIYIVMSETIATHLPQLALKTRPLVAGRQELHHAEMCWLWLSVALHLEHLSGCGALWNHTANARR